MLRVDEDKRISMVDLISHDYVRGNAKQEPSLIVTENSLIQSVASSQSYMTRNKVISKTSVSPEVSNMVSQRKDMVEEKPK
jgi:hypothetical protein